MPTYLDEKRRRISQFAERLRLMGLRAHKLAKGSCFIIFDETPPEDAESPKVKESVAIKVDSLTGPGGCKCGGLGYAEILVRHYLKRVGRTMNDESPLIRQWILLKTLASRKYGASVKELAKEAGVSVKTIRRDLETFQTAGFPLQEIVGDFGRKKWHLESAKPPAELNFTWEEAAALYLGRRLLEPLMGTIFWQAAREAFRKIQAVLEPVPREYLDKFATMFCQTMVGTHDYSKKSDLIDSLMQSIEDGWAVSMTYQSLQATEPVTYIVWPYGLAYHRGSLYLIGRARRHEDICHWKVDRIDAVELKDQRFERPADFDLQKHLAKSFGVFHGDGEAHVKVRFLPAVARYVEESTWHPSQKLTRQRDGSVIAEFTLDGTEEIKRWIMSFGKHATILQPAALRQEILAEVDAMAGTYRMENRASDGARPDGRLSSAVSSKG